MKPAPGKENRYWAMLYMDNDLKFVEVPKAYKVVAAGFEELDLFAYKTWIDGSSDKGKWHVVEAKSGFGISTRANTKARAIEDCDSMLLRMGVTRVRQAIKRSVAKHGLSPRYQAGGDR
jgi:hypothetical protein